VRSLKRLLSPGVLLGLLALVLATSGAAMALPGHNSVRSDDIVNGTIRAVDVHKGTFQRARTPHSLTVFEDQATKTDATVGTGVGSTYTWQAALHDNIAMTGPPVGSSYGTCVSTDAARDTGECNLTLALKGGQLTTTGTFFPTASCFLCSGHVAVVGGSGAFAGASGVMTSSCDFSTVPAECAYAYKFTTP
jgi:hypothetical protein